ncbi:hypothetical protein DFH94DRAFT_781592 [Russula ochroleuca]|jgi:hypothetical protein|uniref:Uncharacterized protein n=1 Tax=Russula ochroleuca TaxID=152965 RepID=A0A9P5JWQ5_9AGAM|nr:hypothetical protein DFH94DRAFT_781592 [Russula ochroleuca]
MSDAEKQQLLDAIHKQLDHAISYNLYSGIAYGMFFAVYCISIRILLSKGSLFNSAGHMIVFGITTIIFILATTVILLGPGLTTQGIPFIIKIIDPSFAVGWSPHKLNAVVGFVAVITRLNPFLSDVVCAWRAAVLWKYDRRVVTLLTVFVLGTLAACSYDLKLALQTQPGTQGEQNLEEGKVAVIVAAPMLGTNVLSTFLIAWKAWEYRRVVGTQLRRGSHSERLERVLALLIESGFGYCLLWTFYLLSAFTVLPGSGSYIVNVCMLFFASMYPAVIVIIVCTQMGHEAYTVRQERSNRLDDLGGLDLTTVDLPIGASTFESGQFPSASYRGKESTMSRSPNFV